jgi:hypothetical protein
MLESTSGFFDGNVIARRDSYLLLLIASRPSPIKYKAHSGRSIGLLLSPLRSEEQRQASSETAEARPGQARPQGSRQTECARSLLTGWHNSILSRNSSARSLGRYRPPDSCVMRNVTVACVHAAAAAEPGNNRRRRAFRANFCEWALFPLTSLQREARHFGSGRGGYR